ncbi:MAG: hypothetical protein DI568_04535 [Sphingomonas sp.]|nr:MAG: hypothetical protein DI568_04535 [Sphingomonas sp.]
MTMATATPSPGADLQSLLPAPRPRKALHGPAPGAPPPSFELPPDDEPLPAAQPDTAMAANTGSQDTPANPDGAGAAPSIPPPAPPPEAESYAATPAPLTATGTDQAPGPHADSLPHPPPPLRVQTTAPAGPPPEAESPVALPQFAATPPQPRTATAQSGPQLPPLRLESDAPRHPQQARPADMPAPPNAPATTTASALATPADIRISTPGEQALQVTLVAANPDLRDRISSARSELRADLARVGAEVDLISVELRPQPGASSANTGQSQQGSDWRGSGQSDGGTEMNAGDFGAGTLSKEALGDGGHNQPFTVAASDGAASDGAPDLLPDNQPQADAIAGDPVIADAAPADGAADRDRNTSSGAQQGHQGSRGMAEGGGHSPGHPFARQPARPPEVQPALRQPLPAPAGSARTDSNRIDRYA